MPFFINQNELLKATKSVLKTLLVQRDIDFPRKGVSAGWIRLSKTQIRYIR